MENIRQNLEHVRQKIEAASKAAGRAPSSVKLIAVSKGKTADEIKSAIKAGQNVFGENRVQEAKGKFVALRALHNPLELHLIGPLQTNKAEDALSIFDVIQTLDRPNLADVLAKIIKKQSRKPKFYVEVNLGSEPQKSGIAPSELSVFLKYCRESCDLAIEGLMCIPPHEADPRSFFMQLKDLATKYKLQRLSMGMSDDFEIATSCGATDVRVGTAIFGKR